MTTPAYGIFARVFPAGTSAQVAAAIRDAGYALAQLNLKSLGLPTIPDAADWASIRPGAIRQAFAAAGVSIWGVSCSYNMAHPDPAVRRAGTAAALALISHAGELGAGVVTLCTGSRNPEKMWAHHPDNASRAAWCDMRAELDRLIAAASQTGVVLGVEPERGNIVSDAEAALRLYAELGSESGRVGIIADSANLLAGLPASSHRDVLERSFASLAQHIICLHAKDLVPWAETLEGRGVVDYRLVASLYRRLGLASPLIVQDTTPEQASPVGALMRSRFGG